MSDAYPLATTVMVDVKDVNRYATLAAALFSEIVEDTKLENEMLVGWPLNVKESVVKLEAEIVADDDVDKVIDDVSKVEESDVIAPFTVIVEFFNKDPVANPI